MALTDKQLQVRLKNKTLTIDEFGDLLRSLPEKAIPRAERHLAEYLRDAFETDEPEYKYKSRAAAYGLQPQGDWEGMKPVPGYFSAKQFRFVMAGIAKGTITPGISRRTGEAGRGWKVSGRGPVSIRNDVSYSGWLFSDRYQARQPRLVGWHTVSELFERNRDDAFSDLVDYIDETIVEIF